jgi:hypothetical protein
MAGTLASYTYNCSIICPTEGENEGKFFAECRTGMESLKPAGPFDTYDEAKQFIMNKLSVHFEIFRQRVDGRI